MIQTSCVYIYENEKEYKEHSKEMWKNGYGIAKHETFVNKRTGDFVHHVKWVNEKTPMRSLEYIEHLWPIN